MSRTNAGKTIVFVLSAYGISWLLWSPGFFEGFFRSDMRISPLFHYAGSYGPITAGLLTVSLFEKKAGRQSYLKRIFRFPEKYFWYLFPLLTPAFLLFTAGGVEKTVFGTFPDYRMLFVSPLDTGMHEATYPNTGAIGILFRVGMNWLLWSLTFGIGEEGGWRGFLFTHLSGRNNARVSALVTGLFWAGWHLPLFFFDPGFKQMAGFGLVGWLIGLISGSILLSWMTISAGWSIIPAVLWHGTFDTVVSGTNFFTSAFCSMAVAGIAIYIWFGLGTNRTGKKRLQSFHVEMNG